MSETPWADSPIHEMIRDAGVDDGSSLAASTCSLEKLKADFDRAIAAMSDEDIIEAFREAGCEITIQRQENGGDHE